ncbi:ubiquitin thiolesterase [Exophiala viscosa]|uniref:ubiquitinyl hydrolase 1 n=1 Tax=Exophiala viscosa TaxID=2486360 RepID=A0AAN6DS08_9EURO|nr:ubiquitin thiolesterase [Exophiala viscosa]KAI1624742.1 ubiquitin thiolesterase [Exophiala viscosa]
MNNPQTRATESPFFESQFRTTSYPTETKVISALALLVLGYYAITFLDAWPSTTKRSSYELFLYLFPSPLLYAMQYVLIRIGRLTRDEARFSRADFGNIFAKQEAMQKIFGQPQMPLVLRKVRSLSGVGNYISLSNEIGPPGLGNWDNSCYQNSVLQGLASMPAFLEYIKHSLELCDRYSVSAETHRALLNFLEQLADSSCQKTTLWTPGVLKSMDSWQQQDAQEYFSRIMDAAEKEAKAYTKRLKRPSKAGLECLKHARADIDHNDEGGPTKHLGVPNAARVDRETDTTPIQFELPNPIDGMTAQALECTTCGFTEGMSLTQFNCLTLNLGLRGPTEVEELLDEYTAPEEVEGVECDYCTKVAHGEVDKEDGNNPIDPESQPQPKKKRPGVLRTKAKQITIGRLPRDLVLHINRSIFDDFGNQLKNTAPVKVPARLNFLSRWCAPLEEDGAAIEAVYELKCIVTHYGRHDNGHYVALGKRGKEWYSFNDEFVTNLTEDEVVARGNGFMLFYEAMPFQTQPVSDTNKNDISAGFIADMPDNDPSIQQAGNTDPKGSNEEQPEVEASDSDTGPASFTDGSEESPSCNSASAFGGFSKTEADMQTGVSVPHMRTAGGSTLHEQRQQAAPPVVSAL